MKPYYEDGSVTIFHGDCRDVLPEIEPASVGLVLTDPPYGIGVNTEWKDRRPSPWAKGERPVHGDDEPFDPTPLLAFKRVVMWGANHYADRLPASADWLIWDKRRGGSVTPGWNAPDAELAWSNLGRGCRLFVHLWEGYKRDSEIGQHFHPTQKPAALMRWCLELDGKSGPVLDPYMGSGTTLRAAKDFGRKAIGIEVDEAYCEIAVKRLAQGSLFGEAV